MVFRNIYYDDVLTGSRRPSWNTLYKAVVWSRNSQNRSINNQDMSDFDFRNFRNYRRPSFLTDPQYIHVWESDPQYTHVWESGKRKKNRNN